MSYANELRKAKFEISLCLPNMMILAPAISPVVSEGSIDFWGEKKEREKL